MVQYSAVVYSTVWYSEYITVYYGQYKQCIAVYCGAVQCCVVQYSTIMQYRTVL